MTILTRIKNNQVTDNTIEYQKLKDGTLVGSKFNANLTLNSNVTILGNLTVANSFAQLNSINTYINDPIVVFNNNYAGSPTYDIGMLVNRNLSSLPPYGAVNAAFVWKEADSAFEALMTSETGTTAGSINNSGWANVKLGNLTAVTGNVTETFNVVGASTFNTIEVTNLSTFNGNTIHNNTVYITDLAASTNPGNGALVVAGGTGIGGNLNVYGNITTATGNIITTSSGIFYGDAEGHGAIYAGVPSGYTFLPNVVVQLTSNVNSYSQLNFQNINGGNFASSDVVCTADDGDDTQLYIDMGIASSTYNNPTYSAYQPHDGYVLVDGNDLLLNVEAAGKRLKVVVGGYTADKTVLSVYEPNIQSTSTTIGSFVLTGGAGISQNLNVGGTTKSLGNVVAASGTSSTNTTSGALVVTGGAGVSGNLNVGSLLTITGATSLNSTLDVTGATTFGSTVINNGNIVAASGTASTNSTTGALVVVGGTGVSGALNVGSTTNIAGITSITNATASTTSANGALVVTGGTGIGGNLNVGGSVVITGDLTVQGDVTTLNTSTLDVEDLNITVAKGAVSAAAANGAGLTVDGASATLLYTSATDSWNINKQLIGTGAQFANTTVSTSATTGALVVAGGVGIGGDLYAYQTNATYGNVTTLSAGNFSSGNAAITGAQTYIGTGATLIANIYAGTAYFTNLSGANISGVISLSATTSVATNFSTGNAQITGGDVNGITTMSATTSVATNFSTGNAQITGGDVNGITTMSATTSVATNFSTANAVVAGGSIDNTPVGASTASTGRFTTVVTTGTTTVSGNLVANSLVNSTNINTGALVVVGGAGIASNVFVGGASTFNSNQTSGYDTIIKGANDSTLIWARPNSTYDSVVIGNSATVGDLVIGAKLIVNSTASMILPNGSTAQRPSNSGGSDVTGMFRFNTTQSALEVYNGTEWDSITTQFTVITDEQFSGDDVTTVFGLSGTSTTAATVVSINGVIQIPTSAYSVTGSTLTFTEAPATGDLIDVRRLATTSVVSGIASTNGYMQFIADNNGAYIYTGSTGTSPTTYWDTSGAQVASGANVSVTTANVLNSIDSFSSTTYRSAVYQVQVTRGTAYQVQTVTVLHDGANVTAVTHGVVQTNGNLGVFDANILSGTAHLNFVPSGTGNIVRIKKDYILI